MGPRRISRLSVQLFLTDLLIIPIGLAVASWLRWVLPFGQELPPSAIYLPFLVYLMVTISWSISLVLSGAYDPQRVLRWFNEASRVIVAGFLATIVTAGALYMTYREVSRLQFVYIFVVTLGLLLAHRALLRISYRLVGKARPGSQGRVLIVGAGDLGQRVAQVILDHSRWGYSLIGFLDDDEGKQGDTYTGAKVLGKIFEVKVFVAERRVDEVWIALPVWALDRLNLVINELEKLPVRIKVVPDYFSLAMVQAKAEILGGIPIIGLREPVIEGLPRLLKRGFDLVIGSLLLLLAAPPMLVIAIAIRLDSSGYVIFRQERVGENGRLFGMYKFRTMVTDAEAQQDQVNIQTEDDDVLHKRPDDPRVTKVGHFLRRYSLDELPQLINVIKGEMSLVGPRPEMPWLVDRYESWQRKRFAVPQGITGWWQINGRSDKPMHMNPEDDLYYVYNYSLWLDIQILLRTPLAVLQGRGAF
jgi:exopolysaccharide biosynthesis polyprenyl glycosylphosphotransferase